MMELPQPRPFGTGGKKAAHDFLSQFSHSSIQQDPRHSQDPVGKLGQWTSEQPLQPSSNHHSSFSSISSSQPSAQKIQSFMEMIKYAKGNRDEEEDDDEEFVIKKEGSSNNEDLTVNVDGKSTDQKGNNPRSKHSATEQRRRSKINDRFQMLRELIPHSDQKRDKASFLLEVIEYIQYLQEKVDKYEGSFHGSSHETTRLMPWSKSHKPVENFVDPSRGINSGSGPALMSAAKLDENNMTISPAILKSAQNLIESDISTATTFKAMERAPGSTNKSVAHPIPLQPSIFVPVGIGGTVTQLPPGLTSDVENRTSLNQPQLWQSKACKTECTIAIDKLKEQELTIEGGTISIASVYSEGLLNTLTQALQSSGVDLSQASISVQIDLGKRANTRPTAPASVFKDSEVTSTNQAIPCSRVGSSSEDFGQAPKRPKTSKN